MRRATTVVVAGVVVVALVLGGALATGLVLRGGDETPAASPATPSRSPSLMDSDTAAAAAAPDPALADYYGQQLDWGACDSADQPAPAECAALVVPVDYTEPDGDTIDLALLRVPASGEPIASMVVNPGGPGAPGTSYAAAATRVFGRALTTNLDVVGFDPRGTGGSDPVDCLDDDQLDDYVAQDPDPDTTAEGAAFEEAQKDFFAGCVARSDDLLGHVTTVEAARDMDLLRSALGESRLTYFGASYGTKLGATYAELFPDRVGRFVLDGAVDVSLPSRELSLGQAGGFEVALRAYVSRCTDEIEACFLGDSLEEGLSTITTLLDSIEEDPLPTGDGRDLTVGRAFYGVVAPLYNRDYWPLLDQSLRTALTGDGTGLLVLADAYSARGPDGYTDNSVEALYAINCLDDPYAVSADEVPDKVPAFEKVSPTFGEVFAWGLVGCEGIQVERSDPEPEIDGSGADPILVVGTTRDPATPYEWAVSLADQLDSGVLLTRDGDGHTGYGAGNACVDSTIEDYLLAGTVPEDGKRC